MIAGTVSAGDDGGRGDFTKERREMPEPTIEEAFTDITRRQVIMDDVKREHPEYTLRECLAEASKRAAKDAGGVLV